MVIVERGQWGEPSAVVPRISADGRFGLRGPVMWCESRYGPPGKRRRTVGAGSAREEAHRVNATW